MDKREEVVTEMDDHKETEIVIDDYQETDNVILDDKEVEAVTEDNLRLASPPPHTSLPRANRTVRWWQKLLQRKDDAKNGGNKKVVAGATAKDDCVVASDLKLDLHSKCGAEKVMTTNVDREEEKPKRKALQFLKAKRKALQFLRLGDDCSHDIFQGEKQLESQEFCVFLFSQILEATRHFSNENKLGEGGFGPVYKGVLAHGKEIAVKRLERSSMQGLKEFENEVTLIAKLQHKNLVRLLGCCLDGNELLLVYEYMPNKSLDVHLFDSTKGIQLNWKRRTNIISGIARGLLYLHEDSQFRIIHLDLKPSNILLDTELNSKISDFGLAKIFSGNQNEAETDRIVGTYGYMAPEYVMKGLFSVKSDVFSFGVVLLEILSGRKNTGFHLSEHGQSLLDYAWKLWCEGHALALMDPVLVQSCVTVEFLKLVQIGLLCVQEDPIERPTMSSVVVMLVSDTTTLPRPTQPAFSDGRVAAQSNHSSSEDKGSSVDEVTV